MERGTACSKNQRGALVTGVRQSVRPLPILYLSYSLLQRLQNMTKLSFVSTFCAGFLVGLVLTVYEVLELGHISGLEQFNIFLESRAN